MGPGDMDQQESNDYLNTLLSGKSPPPNEALEAQSLANFRQLASQIAALQLRLQKLNAERDQLSRDIPRLVGQREAYVTILLGAENGRRKIAAMKKMADGGKKVPGNSDPRKPGKSRPETPVDLEELKKKAGADKVEAIDPEGRVVESTEGENDGLPAGDPEPAVPDTGTAPDAAEKS
jgi:hypothetical protein